MTVVSHFCYLAGRGAHIRSVSAPEAPSSAATALNDASTSNSNSNNTNTSTSNHHSRRAARRLSTSGGSAVDGPLPSSSPVPPVATGPHGSTGAGGTAAAGSSTNTSTAPSPWLHQPLKWLPGATPLTLLALLTVFMLGRWSVVVVPLTGSPQAQELAAVTPVTACTLSSGTWHRE